MEHTNTPTFAALGVLPLFVKALDEIGIKTPTEIQVKTLPLLISKTSDFIGQAQTGTGKTAAFGLPILQAINTNNPKIQALILVPTRELGIQISKALFKFTKYLPEKIFVESIYGGAHLETQIRAQKRPTHIVVATPGRLVDMLERKAIDISNIKTLVLDEADEMLSMGFKKELDTILTYTAGNRHTWLFSATMPEGIKGIIKKYMSPNALKIEVAKHDVINKNINHLFVVCDRDDKLKVLIEFLKKQENNRGLIFCRTKAGAQTLTKQLIAKKINADTIHGDMMQLEREKVMRAFKNEKLQILIATDIAARGIDVKELSYVVHFNLPEQIEYYTHRSGRTARAGLKGISLCLITRQELSNLKRFEKELGITLKENYY